MSEPSTYDNDRFEDDYASGGSSATSYKQIVMAHIERIAKLAATDWNGGFWETVGDHERYHPSTREAYIHAVEGLIDLSVRYAPSDVAEIIKAHHDSHAQLLKRLEDDNFNIFAADPAQIDNNLIEEIKKHIAAQYRQVLRDIILLLHREKLFDEDVGYIDLPK